MLGYVPDELVRLVRAELDRFPCVARYDGECAGLIVDICGFTELAAELSARGPEGAEALSELVNECFGDLVRCVYEHGGEVDKFVGDAVLAYWRISDSIDLSTTTRATVHCASEILDELNDRTVGGGHRIALRAGVGAGRVMHASIGGVDERWEFFTGGDLLRQLDRAARAAQPGEIYLSDDAMIHLAGWVESGRVGDGVHRLLKPSPAISIEPHRFDRASESLWRKLRPYVSRQVLDRIDAGQAEWMSEIRRVTVSFIQLEAAPFTPPEAIDDLQRAFQALQTAVYRYEGSVNQVVAENKSITVLIVHGAYLASHEDNASRALSAGLEIKERLTEQGLHVSLGIATGSVFAGRRGTERRCEYAIIGDAVNVAARLMQYAAREILCDAETAFECRRAHAFAPSARLKVKGKLDLIEAFTPTGQKPDLPIAQSTMVGRHEEYELLRNHLRELPRGMGGLVVVEGEAGIGKTRLIADVLSLAAQEEVETTTIRGRSIAAIDYRAPSPQSTAHPGGSVRSQSTGQPYAAWKPVYDAVFGLTHVQDRTLRQERVLEHLRARQRVERAPLLNAVMSMELPESDWTKALADGSRPGLILSLLEELLLDEWRGRARLVIVEDAHWLDSASWNMIASVHRRMPNVLLLIAMRPWSDHFATDRPEVLESSRVVPITLERLGQDDSMMMACRLLGVDSLPVRVRRYIERGEGHPFFIEELVNTLRESGRIRVEDGECLLNDLDDDLGDLAVSHSVEEHIRSRIDRLAPTQNLLIKLASVIGQSFGLAALVENYPVAEQRPMLPGELLELDRLNLTLRSSDEGEPRYEFKHALTRQVSYELLTPKLRRKLHHSVANWYEKRFSDNLASHVPTLAHHWSEARVAHKAIDYLEIAGNEASGSGLHQETFKYFNRALDFYHGGDPSVRDLVDSVRMAGWRRQLSGALLGLGDLQGCTNQLLEGLRLLGQPSPRSVRSITSLLPSPLPRRSGPEVLIGPPRARVAEAAHTAERLMQPFYFNGEFIPFVLTSLLATRLATRADILEEIPRARIALALACGIMRLRQVAERRFDEALLAARSSDRRYDVVINLYTRALYYQGLGKWDESEIWARRAVEEARRLGDPQAIEESQTIHGLLALFTGRFLLSKTIYEEVLESARGRSNRHHESWGLYAIARALIPMGQIARASALLAEALRLLPSGDILSQTMCYGLQCHARVEEGRLDDALRSAAEAKSRIWRSFSPVVVHGHTGICETHLAICERAMTEGTADFNGALREADRACRRLELFSMLFPMGRPFAQLYRARFHWVAGRHGRAMRTWERCLTSARSLKMPYEQALALYDRGRLTRSSTSSEADAREARRLFSEMNCVKRLEMMNEGRPTPTD